MILEPAFSLSIHKKTAEEKSESTESSRERGTGFSFHMPDSFGRFPAPTVLNLTCPAIAIFGLVASKCDAQNRGESDTEQSNTLNLRVVFRKLQFCCARQHRRSAQHWIKFQAICIKRAVRCALAGAIPNSFRNLGSLNFEFG